MTVETLNDYVRKGIIGDVIRVDEARQVRALAKIADDIASREGIKLVTIVGGSSSGKTTTSIRLSTQLLVNDLWTVHLSTDDYFKDSKYNPINADGTPDYEHVDCVDSAGLVADIRALLCGERIQVRKFDFGTHKPTWIDDQLWLEGKGCVVLEGIHAFNPVILDKFDPKSIYRISIDPKPDLILPDGLELSSANARFLRRLIRDNHFRKLDAEATIKLWPHVLEGEKKWIEPFRKNVDAEFNSYLSYEMGVLKNYAGGPLEYARKKLGELPMLVYAIEILRRFEYISPEKIPGDSILRETIGGSQLDY